MITLVKPQIQTYQIYSIYNNFDCLPYIQIENCMLLCVIFLT